MSDTTPIETNNTPEGKTVDKMTRKQVEAKRDELAQERAALEIRVSAIDNMTRIDLETENEYYEAVQRIRSITRELFELSQPRRNICHHTAALVTANID